MNTIASPSNIATETSKAEQGLFANKSFIWLWLSCIFTGLSLSVYLLAETWYVIHTLNLSTYLGIVLMATTLPRILLMLFGGVMADRFRPSVIMSLSTGIRGLLIVCIIAALMLNLLTIWVLLIFALIFGVLDAFFWPANGSIIPSIVSKNQLNRANSIIQTTSQITYISGPIIAGWLLAVSSYTFLFGFTGFLLVISALVIRKVSGEGTKKQTAGSTWDQLKEGLTYVRNTPLLLNSMMMGIIINLCFAGPVNLAGPIIINELLKGNALDLSYIESAVAVGMVLGGFIVGIWNPTRKRGLLSLARLLMLGVALLLFSQVSALWECVVVAMMIGFLITAGDIPMRSLNQENTDPDKRGRVSGINATVSQGLIPLSFALTSFVLSMHVSILHILFICGIALILYTCFGFWKFKALRNAN